MWSDRSSDRWASALISGHRPRVATILSARVIERPTPDMLDGGRGRPAVPRDGPPTPPSSDSVVMRTLMFVGERRGLGPDDRTDGDRAAAGDGRRLSSGAGSRAGPTAAAATKPTAACSSPSTGHWRRAPTTSRSSGRRCLEPGGEGPGGDETSRATSPPVASLVELGAVRHALTPLVLAGLSDVPCSSPSPRLAGSSGSCPTRGPCAPTPCDLDVADDSAVVIASASVGRGHEAPRTFRSAGRRGGLWGRRRVRTRRPTLILWSPEITE